MNADTFIPCGRDNIKGHTSSIALYGGADEVYIRTKTEKVAEKKVVVPQSRALIAQPREIQILRHVARIVVSDLKAKRPVLWLKANVIAEPGRKAYVRLSDMVAAGFSKKALKRATPDGIGRMLQQRRERVRAQTEKYRTSKFGRIERQLDRGELLGKFAEGAEVHAGLLHNGEIWSQRMARIEVPASQIGSFSRHFDEIYEACSSSPTLFGTEGGKAIFMWPLDQYRQHEGLIQTALGGRSGG